MRVNAPPIAPARPGFYVQAAQDICILLVIPISTFSDRSVL